MLRDDGSPFGEVARMSLGLKQTRQRQRLLLMLCALVVTGCAGLPRIDPSGERVLIWPQSQPVVATPGVGSVQAPPVYTDPVFPTPATQPGLASSSIPVVSVAEDRMAITPDRIMAPVGTEVILRAGICAKEGFLLTHQKVEWLVARESAGEIVALGGRGYCRNPLLPWNKPKKIDNQYGIGYTAKVPLLITRGTANPADDVQVEPGHAWASITSPVEGISNVTAMTPSIVNWAARRATATIYWIDAQWEFPAASISAAGSQVLTTTLLRQTDQSPLAGWIVRYRVAGGAGDSSGNQSGQVVKAVTGADGRASIDVTPTGSDGSVTRITMQLIRPAGMGGEAYPRLVVANGSTTINWTGQSTPYLPDLDQPVGGPATSQPQWDSPPSSQPIGPPLGEPRTSQPTLPKTPRAAGRPQLDVQVYDASQTSVGEQATFQIVIRNQGNASATGIVLTSRYQEGLSRNPTDDRVMAVKNSQVGTLGPGQTRTLNLNFIATKPGRLCHDVFVTCNEYSSDQSAKATGCVNAVQPEPQGYADFELSHEGPRQVSVGDTAYFKITIRNTGDVPLTNLQVVADYKDPLRPVLQGTGFEFVNESIYTRIDRMDVGASKTFEIPCSCLRESPRVSPLVTVTDSSGIRRTEQHEFEITPRQGDSNVVPGAEAGRGQTLGLRIEPASDTVRAQASTSIRFYVENKAQVPQSQMLLRIQFPPEMTPDLTQQQNTVGLRASLDANNIVTYDRLAELGAGERLEFLIPTRANQSGVGTIVAEVSSVGVTSPVQKTQRITIINR